MRILMTTDAVGGVWQYSLDLSSGLSRHGYETVLAVLGPAPDRAQLRAAHSITQVDVVATGLPLDWLAANTREVQQAARSIRRLAESSNVDLVHVNGPALAAYLGTDVPVVAMPHSCVKTWWAAVRGAALPHDFTWRAALVDKGLRSADAMVAPTRAFADAVMRAYDLPRRPTVVHNGRSPAMRQAPADSAPREAFVFTAGRLWDDGKNIAALDRAAEYLAVPVVAAGPLAGPNGAAVTLKHVQALGTLDDAGVAGWLAARPIFVSTALYEPFGLAVLEAAQAGCALVLSDIPTFRELWSEAAEFVDPRDDQTVAAILRALSEDPERRQRLGAAALRRARHYSVAAMADRMAELYGTLPVADPAECAAVA